MRSSTVGSGNLVLTFHYLINDSFELADDPIDALFELPGSRFRDVGSPAAVLMLVRPHDSAS
jgi:hypothetical protein